MLPRSVWLRLSTGEYWEVSIGEADKGNSISDDSNSLISDEGSNENTIVQHTESGPTAGGKLDDVQVTRAQFAGAKSTAGDTRRCGMPSPKT